MFKPIFITLFGATLLLAQADQIARQEQEKKKPAPPPVFTMNGAQPGDPAAIERGKKAFEPACGFCHGLDARGKSGPDLLRSTLVLHDENGDQLGPFLSAGRPDRGMPAFPGMTKEQISDLAAFLHNGTLAISNRMAYEIKGILTGDPKQGEAFFNGKGLCASCHSITGDLAHIASKYEPVELQRRMLMPAPNMMDLFMGKKVKPPPPAHVTVMYSTGESHSGTLIHKDEFTVVMNENGANKTYKIDSRTSVKVEDPLAAHETLLSVYTDAQMHNTLAYLETLK